MNMRFWLRAKDPISKECRKTSYEGRGGVLDQWYHMVEVYSSRQLTFSSDVLPALSGIAIQISQVHGLSFVAGLWQQDLQLGLLWQDNAPNGHSDPEPSTNHLDPRSSLRSIIDSFLPSWDGRIIDPKSVKIDDWEIISGCGKPSWSWISHFLSGRSVKFNHRRKYILEKNDGIEILNVQVTQSPSYGNPFGEILSATLRVRARVKVAVMPDIELPEHMLGHGRIGPYRLIDPRASRAKDVGEFYPDSIDMIERTKTIYCILCAVAIAQHDGAMQKATGRSGIYTAIGVVPSLAPGRRDQFIRVGLVNILDDDWFKDSAKHLGRGSSDDSQIIELI